MHGDNQYEYYDETMSFLERFESAHGDGEAVEAVVREWEAWLDGRHVGEHDWARLMLITETQDHMLGVLSQISSEQDEKISAMEARIIELTDIANTNAIVAQKYYGLSLANRADADLNAMTAEKYAAEAERKDACMRQLSEIYTQLYGPKPD